MNKQRDSRGRFLPNHDPLYSSPDGIKKPPGPPPMTYREYTQVLQKMMRKQKKEAE